MAALGFIISVYRSGRTEATRYLRWADSLIKLTKQLCGCTMLSIRKTQSESTTLRKKKKTQTNKSRSENDGGKTMACDQFTSSASFAAKNSLCRRKYGERKKNCRCANIDFVSKWQFHENSLPSPPKISSYLHLPSFLFRYCRVYRYHSAYVHSDCVQFSETKQNEFDRFFRKIYIQISVVVVFCLQMGDAATIANLDAWYAWCVCSTPIDDVSSMASRRRREMKWLIANNNWIKW